MFRGMAILKAEGDIRSEEKLVQYRMVTCCAAPLAMLLQVVVQFQRDSRDRFDDALFPFSRSKAKLCCSGCAIAVIRETESPTYRLVSSTP